MQQLLWIETLLKLTGGLALCLAPTATARLLGLPPVAGFWQRVLGALLIGLAAATFIAGAWPSAGGLGPAGCAAVNLAAAGMIAGLAGLGMGAPTRRGATALWALVALLVLLSLLEIAHI